MGGARSSPQTVKGARDKRKAAGDQSHLFPEAPMAKAPGRVPTAIPNMRGWAVRQATNLPTLAGATP
eukprot:2529765-Pyramimonas_sp.AAC.1